MADRYSGEAGAHDAAGVWKLPMAPATKFVVDVAFDPGAIAALTNVHSQQIMRRSSFIMLLGVIATTLLGRAPQRHNVHRAARRALLPRRLQRQYRRTRNGQSSQPATGSREFPFERQPASYERKVCAAHPFSREQSALKASGGRHPVRAKSSPFNPFPTGFCASIFKDHK
jgi:hypothetical protein